MAKINRDSFSDAKNTIEKFKPIIWFEHTDKFVSQEMIDSLKIDFEIPNINSFLDLKTNYPITNEVDVLCDSNDKNACTVCVSKHKKVLFVPCHHSCCASCSLRLNKCHICRQNITSKIVYNKH